MTPPDERRRDGSTRAAILHAVEEITAENGYQGLSVEGVARRAGAGKQTIYRWWPSLHAVVIDSMIEAGQNSADFPDTGDLVSDLRTQLHELVELMNSPAIATYQGLIGAAQTDPELAADLYRRIIEPRVLACQDRITKAQAAGQIRGEVDPLTLVEMVYAPLYYRLLVSHKRISKQHVDDILQLAFAGVKN